MRYSNLIHNGLSRSDEKRIVNIGDSFEILAIDKLYRELGIKDIANIDMYDLERYSGEELILPINFMFFPNILDVNFFNMSEDIIPVFLGLCLAETQLSREQKEFLKKWEPIGCRDERTRDCLKEAGIQAYLGGCIALQHEPGRDKRKKRENVAFIDVPYAINEQIPYEIRQNMVFLDNEFYMESETVLRDPALKTFSSERIKYLDDNVRMIVTSRFHGAVIGLALGIPVILVAENNFYKYSWLSKLQPFYETENGIPNINWKQTAVDVREIKRLQRQIAATRLLEHRVDDNACRRLDALLENKDYNRNRGLHYVSGAKDYIQEHWRENDKQNYSIWGINENAEILYKWICEHYPNFKLTGAYDGLRNSTFAGLQTRNPNRYTMDDSFCFVTSNTAKKPAVELFYEIDKHNFYVCELDFMREADKSEKN